MPAIYDTIGLGYADLRRPDPSIDRTICKGLGNAASVINVGAGSGSYESSLESVVAVELSMTMIRQRPVNSAQVVQATAMALPFKANAFDASLAVLTVHHWPDKMRGLDELCRVARDRVVILTWDPTNSGFWLADYIPEILDADRGIFPLLHEYESVLGPVNIVDVPIPHDCTDGFMCAYWRRPEAYLNPRIRTAISTFAKLGDVSRNLQRLDRDLKSGQWHHRYAHLQDRPSLDLGYRLIIST